MSKSGQSSTKADTGGQRVPKNGNDNKGSEKKEPQKTEPSKKASGPKRGA